MNYPIKKKYSKQIKIKLYRSSLVVQWVIRIQHCGWCGTGLIPGPEFPHATKKKKKKKKKRQVVHL